MRKYILFVLCIILAFSFTGCGEKPDTEDDGYAENWGVTLEAQNVTPTGLTLVCHQLGGDAAELTTGSYYVIQRAVNGEFSDIEYLPHEYDIAWTTEAWLIHKDATTTWNVDWEWLYGELPAGEYRIGKEIMNFRGVGDYDKRMMWAEFEIKSPSNAVGFEGQAKEWSRQEIITMFSSIKESSWKIIDCAPVSDNAYGFVGAVLFLDSEEGTCNVAFINADGRYQKCGTYATVCDEADFTYLGNGAVTYKLISDEGAIYNYKLTISVGGDSVHFVAEDDLPKSYKILPLEKINECTQDTLEEALVGVPREDLLSAWGKPDGNLSGFWGEVWSLDEENDKQITIYYDADGKVEYVKVVDLTE